MKARSLSCFNEEVVKTDTKALISPSRGAYKVILIDDQSIVRSGTASLLRSWGYEVVEETGCCK